MAHMYCEIHGKAKLQEAIMTQGQFEGEYAKIVVGPLSTDGCRCDQCNRPLEMFDIAYYVENLSVNLTDLYGEIQFFDVDSGSVKTYKY